MPFRLFRTTLDDGCVYSMRYVELNEFGQVVAWQAEPMFTVDSRDDVFPLLDEMRAGATEKLIDEDLLAEYWDD